MDPAEAPTVNALWGRIVADELASAGLGGAVISPGSRSTPLTVALAEHPDVETFSVLDERSAAFFALGRARRSGRPVAVVCTSGTAAANYHPAVVEASQSRVPVVVLTADRPPELHDSGANQTVDQDRLYGGSVRAFRRLPEPELADRKLRSLRTAVCRSVATATGRDAGPVHLDVPLRKPLEPTARPNDAPAGVPGGELPADFPDGYGPAVEGREGPWVSTVEGLPSPDSADIDRVADALASADSGLIVCGPASGPPETADPGLPSPEALADLATATGFPIFADPLSGHRYGPLAGERFPGDGNPGVPLCGGYDGYVEALDVAPDVVLRFGASPTSKPLRRYLADAGARQFLVDPAGGWREATFAATDLVVAGGTGLAAALATRVDRDPGSDPFADRVRAAEHEYWEAVAGAEPEEGAVLADAVALAPDQATLFVSNSMPVRDLDRFGRPRAASLTVLGNRGASGIDGVTSTALGAGSATDDPLVAVVGDLAFHHDSNGLLAVGRCGVDATVVCINNDGGGIFRQLPIAAHDTFEEWFRTPHGLDFEHAAALYDLEFARTADREGFRGLYAEAVGSGGGHVIEVVTDDERSHADREALHDSVLETLGQG